MVRRPGGWLFRVVVLAIAGLALGASEPRCAYRIGEADVYGSFILLSAAKVKVGDAAEVDGNVHSNDSVELKKKSQVRGDVSAVEEVKNGGGTITGRVTQRAPAVVLPAMPDKNAVRAQANRVLAGPVKLVAPVIDDVLYVNGAVTIQGEARGTGTLIATGVLTVAPVSASGGGPVVPPVVPGRRLSILAYADVTLQTRSVLRATLRTKGRAVVGESAIFDGSLVADREIELARQSRARFASPADATAPSLTILGPSDPFITLEPTVDLTVLYADAAPGVDAPTFVLRFDGAVVTDRCSVGASVTICSLGLASSGRHEVVAAVSDLAGNTASGSFVFTAIVDATPPSIAIETPASGALVASAEVLVTGTVSDDGVVEQVTLGGAPLAAPGGRFSGSIALAEGSNVIRVTGRDSVGRVGEAAVEVVRDGQAPRLTLRSPEPAAAPSRPQGDAALTVSTTQRTIVVAGAAEDENGVTRVEIGGDAVPLSSGDFEQEVDLVEGANRVRVAAYDGAGNVGAVEIEVDRRTVPTLTILEPIDGSILIELSTVAVRGTVDVPGSVVTVNGLPAAVSGMSFALDELPLVDGATLINVVATSPAGFESSAGVTVLRDVDAPIVSIHEPVDGSTVYQPSIAVTGMVNDVVVGTVNGAQVVVTVNGAAAEVSNRSFLLDRVPLMEGSNTIEVSAVDPSGNVGRDAVVVERVISRGPVLTALSGDRQVGTMGEALPLPLVVVLRDARGVPVPGHAINFLADGTDGVFADGKRQAAVTTDFAGRASVTLTLGRRAGHHTVRAMTTGIDGEALFVARARPAEPALLVVDSGDQQVGATGQPLRAPFAAVVTDDGFNRLAGAVVRFEVIEGGGSLEEGGEALDLVADSDGRVTARLTLGLEEGVGNNVVRAWLVDGPPEVEVTFTASAMVAADPAATSVSGVVLDNSDVPVPGATVSIEGTTLSTRTDVSGYFRLDSAPVGTTHLRVRGATVERPGVWPSLEFLITIIAGRDNSMGRPIYLPVLDVANALAVDEDTGGVLTMRDLPGFALEIEPGSVTFPGGGRSGVITVTAVHSDKVPMPPNFGQQPRFVITIQPGGARFDPPARVTFPNVDGLSPGQVTELYSFDHDLARFVSIGPGTVTGDGTRIVSDRGVGIAKAGWHGGGDPARPGTCHDCGECKSPSGGACVADNAKTPRQKAPDDCKIDRCSGGRVVSSPTNQERAKQVEGNCYEELCPPQSRNVDLGDEPPGQKCCGDPSKPLPSGMGFGVLTGSYDPEEQCCVASGLENGRSIISKRAPINVGLCPQLTEPATPIEIDYSGCSVPAILDAILQVAGLYPPYSGNPNEPTPPANGQALFSEVGNGGATPNAACDRHDRCYQSCGEEQGGCEDAFAEDLGAACEGVTGIVTGVDPRTGQPTSFNRNEVCMAWAGIYTSVVERAGGPAYREGQSTHCDCECS